MSSTIDPDLSAPPDAGMYAIRPAPRDESGATALKNLERITDEEGYSDCEWSQPNHKDKQEDEIKACLEAYKTNPPPVPTSVRFHRVAITGTFSGSIPRSQLEAEIVARGGYVDKTVTAATTLLVAPHLHPRSSKAHIARTLKIPIMDEKTFRSQKKRDATW